MTSFFSVCDSKWQCEHDSEEDLWRRKWEDMHQNSKNINKSRLLSSHQSTTSLVHCHPRTPSKKIKRRKNKQKNSLCQNQIYTAPHKPNALKFGLMDRWSASNWLKFTRYQAVTNTKSKSLHCRNHIIICSYALVNRHRLNRWQTYQYTSNSVLCKLLDTV